MRLSPALLVAVLSVAMTASSSVPALASGAAPAEQQRGLGSRVLSGAGRIGASAARGLGKFLWRQVSTRGEVKASLSDARALRKSGELNAAAQEIAAAPKAQGLIEGIRLWRAKKAIVKAARKDMRAGSVKANPEEGYLAMKTLGAAGKLSLLDKMRGGVSLGRGGRNAFATAKKLSNRGETMKAIEMLEWANDHGKVNLWKQVSLRVRLRGQAMADAEQMGVHYRALPEGAEKDAAFDQMVALLDAAQRMGSAQNMNIAAALPGSLKKMVGGRYVSTQQVVEATGLSQDELGARLEAREKAKQAAVAPVAPAAAPKAEDKQIALDFEKGAEK